MKGFIIFFESVFVPQEGNGNHPFILRREGILFLLAIAFFVQAFFLVQIFYVFRNADLFATVVSNVLIDRTNASRAGARVPLVAVSPILSEAAREKAEDMARVGYFAHTSPAGLTPWYWFKKVGYTYTRAGENLAINFVDSEDVVRAWLESPKHRENMLNRYYTEIGIGMARGLYNGQETMFIVQLFGTPKAVVQKPGIPAVKKPPVAKTATTTPIEVVPSAPSIVAGAENPVDNAVVVTNTSAAPLTETLAENFRYASFAERVVSSSRGTTTLFYVALATLVGFMLTLVGLLRTVAPRAHIFVQGAAFLVIIGTVLFVNNYIATAWAGIR